jgi:phosphoserine aminotransferase
MKQNQKTYNFSPGPATLPQAVRAESAGALLDWQKTGIGVAEYSHRSPIFMAWVKVLRALVRDVLAIPTSHEILWMHGGARQQFSIIPMNFLKGSADYLSLGHWSHQAMLHAKRYGKVRNAGGWQDQSLNLDWAEDADYAFVTLNESIDGLHYSGVDWQVPVPLIVDATSSLGLAPIDYEHMDFIFSSGQKNLGIAGLTTIIIRKDLLEKACAQDECFDYRVHAQSESFYNTPATFSWYVHYAMLTWIQSQGGVDKLWKRNQQWAHQLYELIDADDFYKNDVEKTYRSSINLIFNTPNADLDRKFYETAEGEGLLGLKGHAIRGGLRASLYSGQNEDAVLVLMDFMKQFRRRYG